MKCAGNIGRRTFFRQMTFLSGAVALSGPGVPGTIELRPGQKVRYWCAKEDPAIALAVEDVGRDLDRVLGARLHPVEDPARADLVLVNLEHASWPGLIIRPGEWERFQIARTPNGLVIAGSDRRGLLFGIYQFSARTLGVDPLAFWVPSHPETRQKVALDASICINQPATFRVRGWFLDDHDMLEAWQYGTYREAETHAGKLSKAISYEVYDRVLESMLRLCINLIIPASVMDIDDPEHAEVFRRIRNRGLLFSQHHIEPVGVCPTYAFRHYCLKRQIEPNFSWTNNRGTVEACWRYYIDRIADYRDSVIWQLGYRGGGDQPFWTSESDAPKDMAGRGAIISRAIQRQYDLIEERLGNGADFLATSTLWQEGNLLYQQGDLKLPPRVVCVIADVGRTQMLPQPMPASEPDRKYGIYYHNTFWSTGPHLIQGNPPQNIFANYRRAIADGATEYSLDHVGNFRQFIPGITAIAEITQTGPESAKDFLPRFCRTRFGDSRLSRLYDGYFSSFVHRQEQELQKANSRWLDGALLLFIRHLLTGLIAIEGGEEKAFESFMTAVGFRLQLLKTNPPIQDLVSYRDSGTWICRDWAALISYMTPLLLRSLQSWNQLLKQIEAERPKLRRGKLLFDSNLYWQCLVGQALTDGSVRCLNAADFLLKGARRDAAECLKTAAEGFQAVFGRASELVEQDYFRGWMRGDSKANIASLQQQLLKVADAITATNGSTG